MRLENLFKVLTINYKKYSALISADYKFNAAFRNVDTLPNSFLQSYEWKTIKYYRKFQCNPSSLYGKLYQSKLRRLGLKTGIDFEGNRSIGPGLIIGHWGKVVINGEARLGKEMFITHNVTIGRDMRGKRKGVPSFGDRVCIRTNSCVCGNITIGNDVLIAPNTFVNFDVPDHSVVIGNPASIHHKENATEGHIPSLSIV